MSDQLLTFTLYSLSRCAVLLDMNIIRRKPVILNNLLYLNVSFIRQVFDLKREGKQCKELILRIINPLTGEQEIHSQPIRYADPAYKLKQSLSKLAAKTFKQIGTLIDEEEKLL